MRLYWVDAFFDKIEHSSFDGRNRMSLDRVAQISHPFGLTIFEGTNDFFGPKKTNFPLKFEPIFIQTNSKWMPATFWKY